MPSNEEIKNEISDIKNKSGKINWKKIWSSADTHHLRSAILDAYPDPDMSSTEKAYRFMNDIEGALVCPVCKVGVRKFYKHSVGFFPVCSNVCSNKRTEVKNKRKETVKQRYGVDNVFQHTETKNKSVETNTQRYGVPNYALSADFSERMCDYWNMITPEELEKRNKAIMETSNTRYGTDWPSQAHAVKSKAIDTNLERYGSASWRSSEIGKETLKNIWQERYSVDNPFSAVEVQEKIKNNYKAVYGDHITNPSHLLEVVEKRKNTQNIRYGRDSFKQTHIPLELLAAKSDKQTCEELLTRFNGNVMDIVRNYRVSYSWVLKCLDNHGLFTRSKSWVEKDFNDFLTDNQIGFKQNDRTVIKPLELDFYVPDRNIAFEINGLYWHSELAGKDRGYHLNKYRMSHDVGVKLISIYDFEWANKQSIVKNMVMTKLGINPTIYARKCRLIVTPDKEAVTKFINETHIQGSVNYSLALALEYDGDLVAVMTFGKARYTKEEGVYEILRFCSKGSVVGGMSKLFYHGIQLLDCNKVVTYADLRWGTGDSYLNLGFKFDGYTPPGYYYFKNKHDTIIESRIKYQKHKLSKLLEQYDGSLSEWENMKNNGYNRFWDSGNARYIFIK